MTPRAGLAAPTAAFVDDLIARTRRYGPHLFVCFDDARIPATTNALERFFGDAKRVVRHADGCGSTTNAVVTNLGDRVLTALPLVTRPGAVAALRDTPPTAAAFRAARAQLTHDEAPAIRQRSLVRRFKDHLTRLHHAWLDAKSPPQPNA
jgi:hypothetical protein